MSETSVTIDTAKPLGRPGTLAATVVAATLGAVLLFGVGFANSQILHAAAHDARHALSFPCH
jgi:cobalt transporter subunit CbtB